MSNELTEDELAALAIVEAEAEAEAEAANETEYIYENENENYQLNQNNKNNKKKNENENQNENENENENGNKSIYDFIMEGNLKKVSKYLDDNKSRLLDKKNIKNNVLVNYAVDAATTYEHLNESPIKQNKRFDIVRLFLEKGLSPSIPYPPDNNFNAMEERPLNLAARASSTIAIPIMRLLLDAGANINGQENNDAYGHTRPPIFDSIFNSHDIENFKFLVSRGANINIEYKSNLPLAKAINVGNLGAILYLLEGNAKISSYMNLFGENLFIMALKIEDPEKRLQVVEAFLKRKDLEANFINKISKKTALLVAIDNLNGAILDLLLKDQRFANLLNTSIKSHGTPLAYALSKSTLGQNPIGDVRENYMLLFLDYLVEKGAKIPDINSSPFIKAIDIGLPFLIDQCLRLGFRINSPDQTTGFTPLTYAIQLGSLEMVVYLLEKGADPNTKDNNGYMPINLAIDNGNVEILKLFMKDQVLSELEGTEMILSVIRKQKNSKKIKAVLSYLIDELGYNPFGINVDEIPALMVASFGGNYGAVEFLLEKGADINETIKKEDKDITAYDIAKDMNIRLLLAPFLEKGVTRFRGFLEDDFAIFPLLFEGKYAICPFCFTPLNHTSGCMYIFEHNCVDLAYKRQQEAEAAVVRKASLEKIAAEKKAAVIPLEKAVDKIAATITLEELIAAEKDAENEKLIAPLIIHKKLYDTYRDKKDGSITVCIHCNRAGFTFDVPRDPGMPRQVTHKHIVLNRANPYPEKIEQAKSTNPYDTTSCIHEGGGGPDEKLIRAQILLNFMCYLNENYVGKISSNLAKRLAIEAFWDAPLDEKKYTKENPEESLLNPEVKIPTADVIKIIKSEKKFQNQCDAPKKPLPLPEGVEEGVNLLEEFPNVERYGSNDVDLAPINAGKNEPDVTVENRLFCFYQESISFEDPHTDNRTLWRFQHRQPKRSNEFEPSRIYDHGAKKELICEECLGKAIQNSFADKELKCFNFGQGACEGYFHPNEIQGKVSNELYESYKSMYNRISPRMEGGGAKKNNEAYPSLFGKPLLIQQNVCLLGGKYKRSGPRQKRKTRKAHKQRKTRKAKRYIKTHKH